jgi:hypothetical protein
MRQHENVTTEDIANSTRAGIDEPRAETDPIDSDRTDADRVESDRVDADDRFDADGRADVENRADTDDRTDTDRADVEDRLYDQDHLRDDEHDDDRITTIDETARPADTTLVDQHHADDTHGPDDARGATSGDQQQPGHAAADVLFDEADATRFRARWSEVQTSFVDDPKRAVQDADVLVAELMQSLASAFSERKHLLENQWQQGSGAETEDLRLALRGYRSFLDQLLAR